jgi:hypothetical protein
VTGFLPDDQAVSVTGFLPDDQAVSVTGFLPCPDPLPRHRQPTGPVSLPYEARGASGTDGTPALQV